LFFKPIDPRAIAYTAGRRSPYEPLRMVPATWSLPPFFLFGRECSPLRNDDPSVAPVDTPSNGLKTVVRGVRLGPLGTRGRGTLRTLPLLPRKMRPSPRATGSC